MNILCFLQTRCLEIHFDKRLGRLFALKHETEPWNKAELGRAFETLTENQKLGQEF